MWRSPNRTLSSSTSRSQVAFPPKPQNSKNLPPREINGSHQSSVSVAPPSRLIFLSCHLSPGSRIALQPVSSVVAITQPLGRILDLDTIQPCRQLAPTATTRPLDSATKLIKPSTPRPQPMEYKAAAIHLTTMASLRTKHFANCASAFGDLPRMDGMKHRGLAHGFRFGDTPAALLCWKIDDTLVQGIRWRII